MKNQRIAQMWWTDIPDPDVIRVDDTYYMTSTTMHFTPGCPIMKSKDLIHWEIVNYVYDFLDDSDKMTLQNGKHDYGKGSWASCIRYVGDVFYVVFTAYNTNKTYIFQTKNLENANWERYILSGIYHDMSLLFEEDGKVYMVYGGGTIRILELNSEATGVKTGGMDKVLIPKTDVGGEGGLPAEGAHIYKINGMYYIFLIAWPPSPKYSGRRIQLCYRSDKIDGEYEGKVVLDSDMGYHNMGVAQGGVFDTVSGDWYAMLFQDRGSVGRVPILIPIRWEDGWPVYEVDENFFKADKAEVGINTGFGVVKSDDFDNKKLALEWQWNHNYDDKLWSLEERIGWLKLENGSICRNLSDARNTLTQRTFGPVCSGEVKLDVSMLQEGDFAGLSAFQDEYGYVGVTIINGSPNIIMARAQSQSTEYSNMQYETGKPEVVEESVPLSQKEVYLRVDFDFRDMVDIADFYYSLDGYNWNNIGCKVNMSYRLSHFVGYRFGIFSYGTKTTDGAAFFDYFKLREN